MMRELCLSALLWIWAVSAAGAEPLQSHATRSSPEDLEVTSRNADGSVSSPRYYTYEELSSLPQVTVTTQRDPNTRESATYTGVLVDRLFAALGATNAQNVIGMSCYDRYEQYFDGDYNAKHEPILLLKFDGKPPADWPKTDQDTPQGPYSVVYQHFVPAERIYGYVQPPRIPFGVVSAQLLTRDQAFGPFTPKSDATNPEVMKGQRIAMGSCISCHNMGDAGGTAATQPWTILAAYASSNGDYFRNYVVDPQKLNLSSKMPAHPHFDAKTLDALQAYFKTMAPAGP